MTRRRLPAVCWHKTTEAVRMGNQPSTDGTVSQRFWRRQQDNEMAKPLVCGWKYVMAQLLASHESHPLPTSWSGGKYHRCPDLFVKHYSLRLSSKSINKRKSVDDKWTFYVAERPHKMMFVVIVEFDQELLGSYVQSRHLHWSNPHFVVLPGLTPKRAHAIEYGCRLPSGCC